jgi:maltose alpha-D-glucosyltransferase/alpha-amylase
MARRARVGVERATAGAANCAARECLEAFSRRSEECLGVIDRLGRTPSEAVKIRVHGDYHLGQVLVAKNEMIIVDFEGEPSRSASDRRLKSSPLRDVAGMLRSFSYAAETVVRDVSQRLTEAAPRVRAVATEWHRLSTNAFLNSYEATVRGSALWIEDQTCRRRLLRFYLLSKALYEVDYEANHRPDWIETPVRGVIAILDEEAAST